jgi:hypothetical protein
MAVPESSRGLTVIDEVRRHPEHFNSRRVPQTIEWE